MRIGFEKLVSEYGILPRGYGVSYRLVDQMAYVVHPVPLNLLVRWWRIAYYWVRMGGVRGMTRVELQAENKKLRQMCHQYMDYWGDCP